MLSTLAIVLTTAVVSAQQQMVFLEDLATFPHASVSAPYGECYDAPAALSGGNMYNMTDDMCNMFAYNERQKQNGLGFLYHSPFVCYPGATNIGCVAENNYAVFAEFYVESLIATNMTFTLGIYMDHFDGVEGNQVPHAVLDHNYCVVGCQFCKLIGSVPLNNDPFCPAYVCDKYSLNSTYCLPDIPEAEYAGISIAVLGPEVSSTVNLDTEYDFTFAVYGVSNEWPNLGFIAYLPISVCDFTDMVIGFDAVPFGLSFVPSYPWMLMNMDNFDVRIESGERVRVRCIIILPAGGVTERSFVLNGYFGTEADPPSFVTLTGPVQMANGAYTTTTSMSTAIGSLYVGTTMWYAETYDNTSSVWDSFFVLGSLVTDICNVNTTEQIIIATFDKGARQSNPRQWSGFDYLEMDQNINGLSINMADGSVRQGGDGSFEIADLDNDNYIHLCMHDTAEAASIHIERGVFYDPRNTMNTEATVVVNQPFPMFDPWPTVDNVSVTGPHGDNAMYQNVPTAAPTFAATPVMQTIIRKGEFMECNATMNPWGDDKPELKTTRAQILRDVDGTIHITVNIKQKRSELSNRVKVRASIVDSNNEVLWTESTKAKKDDNSYIKVTGANSRQRAFTVELMDIGAQVYFLDSDDMLSIELQVYELAEADDEMPTVLLCDKFHL